MGPVSNALTRSPAPPRPPAPPQADATCVSWSWATDRALAPDPASQNQAANDEAASQTEWERRAESL
ncbi:hypothetical protein EYF80_003004 [Liparis tanakae]|uniref:Uncharacterized protein n=1 Tax=Liparis tanakae TaxID=230148 RepID=A0A4Z2JA59_9TELE|nr:hypothetical protein EYF80_003004 [Liparis tanakae]